MGFTLLYRCLIASACLLVSTAHAETTVDYFVIAKHARPFQIEYQGDAHSGIVTELVHEIFADSPYTLKTHTYPFNRMIQMLQSGRHHNWITYGSPVWPGPQSANLSTDSLMQVRHVVLSRKERNFQFRQIDDLYGKSVVLFLGFDYPGLTPYLEKGHIEQQRVHNYDAAFRILDRGLVIKRTETLVDMSIRIRYNLAQTRRKTEHYRLDDFSAVIPPYPLHLAFSPDIHPEISDYANRKLRQLKRNGTLDHIIARYRDGYTKHPKPSQPKSLAHRTASNRH